MAHEGSTWKDDLTDAVLSTLVVGGLSLAAVPVAAGLRVLGKRVPIVLIVLGISVVVSALSKPKPRTHQP